MKLYRSIKHRILRTAGFALLGWAALLAGPGRAEDSTTLINRVKSGYLFNFAKYVEWPTERFPTKEAPIVVGIVGRDPISAEIEQVLSGKTIEGRPLLVRQVSDGADPGDCHLLFICASEKKRLAKILASQRSRNVLTVSDLENFSEEGGMISLRKDGAHIRFSINQQEAERAGLKISSKLLQLAK